MTKTKETKKVEKSKDNNKKTKLSKILNIISYCLLVPIFLMFLSMIGSLLITKYTVGVPMVYNYSLLTISSGSMEDAGFNVGDRVFIKKSNPKNYKTGDIIAFYDYVDPFCLNPYQVTDNNKPNKKPKRTRIVFHEIVEVLEDKDGKNWYITKGTNNVSQDRNIIYENYVIGEYQPLSEKTLDVLNFVFSIKGALLFVVLPCTIIIFIDCYTLTGLFMELSAQKKNGKTNEEENLKDDSKNKENNKSKNKKEDDLEKKTTKKSSNKKQTSEDKEKVEDKKENSSKPSKKETTTSSDNKNNNTKDNSQKVEGSNKTKEKSDVSKKTTNKNTTSVKNDTKKEVKKQSSTKSESSKKNSYK